MESNGLGRRLLLASWVAVGAAVAVLGVGVAIGVAVIWASLAALTGGIAVGAIAALATRRWVTDPLVEMTGTLATSLTGQPTTVDPRGPAEVQDLARALNEVAEGMAVRLAELRRESGLREQILSSMSEGVVLADESGRILYQNPAAQDLLSGARTLPAQFRAEGTVELTLRHPRRRELKAACKQFEDGRRLVAVQDVTEAKRIEAMRRDFVADASHELKTPVASIQAVAETLETAVQDDPDAVPRFMRTLLGETRRMSALVQDLLDLARLEGRPPERGLVALSDVVARETDQARPNAERKGLTLRQDVAPAVFVSGNREDLTLALRNLLDNALRYTLSGEVCVRLRQEANQAIMEVIDTGEGIPGKDLGRVFERFYRVDRARARDTGGTGLGLAIVRHVVEQHSGDVRVESDLGRGTRFIVTLPATSVASPVPS